MSTPSFTFRRATFDDVPTLRELIAASVRGLASGDYTEPQIEAALVSAFAVDSQLIADGTYFVAEAGAVIVGCGGWSCRKTLFGGDSQVGREAGLLDPGTEAARIRAFFVHPAWARHGIGRALLERCEQKARRAGFRATSLMATLPGHRLYKAAGYCGDERVTHRLAGDIDIEFVPMRKEL